MALQQLPKPISWPPFFYGLAGGGSLTGVTLDAANEYRAFIFEAIEDMTVTHVGWSVGAVSGSPTANVRIETVGATGVPSGTLWGTNTNIVTGTLTGSSWRLDALTASAVIPKGSKFAVKIQYNSGTSFVVNSITTFHGDTAKPYGVTATPTASKNVSTVPAMALGSSSTTFYNLPAAYPSNVPNTANGFNNTSGFRAAGVRFQVPFKCRCIGMRRGRVANRAGDFEAVLYDDAGAELGSSRAAYDGDFTGGFGQEYLLFANAVELTPGTWYRAVLEPTTATDIGMEYLTLPSADYLSAAPGGASIYYTQRSSGGTWSDTDTRIPWIEILIDQLDDGASGGGGGLAIPNMVGGVVQ